MRHTPGPWECYQVGEDEDEYGVGAGTDEVVRVMGYADARLIAAAPDMLEALENLENDDGHIPGHAWDMVQAAIAKARGED